MGCTLLEQEINTRVCRLYDLTPEESKVVEGLIRPKVDMEGIE